MELEEKRKETIGGICGAESPSKRVYSATMGGAFHCPAYCASISTIFGANARSSGYSFRKKGK
jgi:hypothetical protein